MKPYIKLVLSRPNGHRSEGVIAGDKVTPAMLDAAEDLVTTLDTGERPVPRGLYELAAAAFNVDREEAKRRLMAAAYGAKGKTLERLAKGTADAVAVFGKKAKRPPCTLFDGES